MRIILDHHTHTVCWRHQQHHSRRQITAALMYACGNAMYTLMHVGNNVKTSAQQLCRQLYAPTVRKVFRL
jgi:cysteinyl-tRNA synthetase